MPGWSSTPSPMTAASAPSGCARIAARTASACSRGTKATSLPSLATYIGSRPRIAQALATAGGTGTARSWMTTPVPEALAISLSAAASPPRVGSRSTCRSGVTASMASTRPPSAAQSLSISTPNSRPSRTLMTATPCRPMSPLTITTSPGTTRCGRRSTPAGIEADAGGVDVDRRRRGRPRRPWCRRWPPPRRRRARPRPCASATPGDHGHLDALLQDEAAGEVGGAGAAHGEVVDGAVDGEVADAAAGEEQRPHHVGVGGERQPGAAEGDRRRSRRAGRAPRRRRRGRRCAGRVRRRARRRRRGP